MFGTVLHQVVTIDITSSKRVGLRSVCRDACGAHQLMSSASTEGSSPNVPIFLFLYSMGLVLARFDLTNRICRVRFVLCPTPFLRDLQRIR